MANVTHVHLFIPQICVSDVLDKTYPIMELYSSCGGEGVN